MADRLVPQSMTFEEWRQEFNELATDFGDFTTIDSELIAFGATDMTEAMNIMIGLTKSEKVLAIAIAMG
jgi:hypothetical protein|tara:strand:- start:310 stop:516 length:207 start_codon:yes stop_codon:yes gene_type:complete